MRRRCQRRIVSGVTRRWRRSARGSRRTSAAKTARSAQSRRGLGVVRRSTSTSCRRTSNSTSLMADVRPSSTSSPSTCWKIKYNSRSDTAEIMPSRWRSSIVAGQRQVQHCGTPQAATPQNCETRVLTRRPIRRQPAQRDARSISISGSVLLKGDSEALREARHARPRSHRLHVPRR
jgi:hypothetical protein